MANNSHSSISGLVLGAFLSGLVVAQVMQPQPATSQGNLEDRVAALEAKLAQVTIIEGELNGLQGPHLMIEGANVHIRSGAGATNNNGQLTGLGNLVVGYNEEPIDGLSPGVRGGSHNLVVGAGHQFISFGGLIAGAFNTVSGESASVIGGVFNTASGFAASVSGGVANTASGLEASVSGGGHNVASGDVASVSGGFGNAASGFLASISGGSNNVASGDVASVSGGANNEASGDQASVLGNLESTFVDDEGTLIPVP